MVDVVDRDDRVIDVVTRAEMRKRRLRHRAVFVLVRNSAGEVLIHKRSESKDLWPGWWDVAIGGVVGAGESYDAAAKRELLEEAGIDATPTLIGEGSYEDVEVALVGRCYQVVHDGPAEPMDGEVVEFRWVEPAELRQLLRIERFLPDSLELLGTALFGG
jgi:8-oxo-dGTP pyrophosphatase MutT (NUDIX family)